MQIWGTVMASLGVYILNESRAGQIWDTIDDKTSYLAKHCQILQPSNKHFKYVALDINEYSHCSNIHEGKKLF